MPSIPGGLALLLKPKAPEDDGMPKSDEDDYDEDKSPHEEVLCAMMEKFIKDVHEEDAEAAVETFRDIFELLEKMPHAEIEHDGSNDNEEE